MQTYEQGSRFFAVFKSFWLHDNSSHFSHKKVIVPNYSQSFLIAYAEVY